MNEFKLYKGISKKGQPYYQIKLIVNGVAVDGNIMIDAVVGQVASLLGAKALEVGSDDEENKE